MIDSHIAWFEDHVRSFLTGDPQDDAHIELKRDHSFKVLAEARVITPTLDLATGLARAAHLAALYHDAGRFPQYHTYKTFKDAQSVNHAHLGVRSLRGHAALSDLDPATLALVLGAVVMHNRRELPTGISDDLSLVTRVVRDSDKLDIIRIMLEHLRPGGKESDVVMLHVEDDPERYTSAIVTQIEAGRIGDYALMRYRNDFTLLLLSWVFDLSFRASRRMFLERGHLDELCALLPRTPELTRIGDRIYDVLNR